MRWNSGVFQLKEFIEQYAQRYDMRFEIVLAPQLDAGQMYLTEDSLTESERLVCENAISAANEYLNHIDPDIWKTRHDLTEEDERNLKEISDLIDRELPPNI